MSPPLIFHFSSRSRDIEVCSLNFLLHLLSIRVLPRYLNLSHCKPYFESLRSPSRLLSLSVRSPYRSEVFRQGADSSPVRISFSFPPPNPFFFVGVSYGPAGRAVASSASPRALSFIYASFFETLEGGLLIQGES